MVESKVWLDGTSKDKAFWRPLGLHYGGLGSKCGSQGRVEWRKGRRRRDFGSGTGRAAKPKEKAGEARRGFEKV